MKAQSLFLPCLSVLAVGACTIQVTYSPLGSDVSLSGSWTIDGAPADATSCEAAGITTISLAFFEGSTPRTYPELTWNCADGSFATGPVLAHGRYSAQWQAQTATGLASSAAFPIDVVAAGATHVELGTFAITTTPAGFDPRGTDASLAADWTLNGAPADATLCAEAGISEMQIVFAAQDDPDFAAGIEVARAPCADGAYDSGGNVLAQGTYLTRINALDGTGVVLANYDGDGVLVVDVSLNTHYILMTAPFEYTPPVPTLQVNFSWDTDPTTTMVDADCATAGVTTMNYMLTPMGGGANYDEAFDIACMDSTEWVDIPPGEYLLFVEGFISGVKTWESMNCDMYVVESGVELYNCFMNNTSGGT